MYFSPLYDKLIIFYITKIVFTTIYLIINQICYNFQHESCGPRQLLLVLLRLPNRSWTPLQEYIDCTQTTSNRLVKNILVFTHVLVYYITITSRVASNKIQSSRNVWHFVLPKDSERFRSYDANENHISNWVDIKIGILFVIARARSEWNFQLFWDKFNVVLSFYVIYTRSCWRI